MAMSGTALQTERHLAASGQFVGLCEFALAFFISYFAAILTHERLAGSTLVLFIRLLHRCHTKSCITKPQNVLVLRDVACAGYVAGGNTRFFGEAASGNNTAVTVTQISDAINRRLSFEDGDGEYESMLAFVAPSGDGAKRDQVVFLCCVRPMSCLTVALRHR